MTEKKIEKRCLATLENVKTIAILVSLA